jgi:hypothetical protein
MEPGQYALLRGHVRRTMQQVGMIPCPDNSSGSSSSSSSFFSSSALPSIITAA